MEHPLILTHKLLILMHPQTVFHACQLVIDADDAAHSSSPLLVLPKVPVSFHSYLPVKDPSHHISVMPVRLQPCKPVHIFNSSSLIHRHFRSPHVWKDWNSSNSSVLVFRCSPADLLPLFTLWVPVADTGIKVIWAGWVEIPLPQQFYFTPTSQSS